MNAILLFIFVTIINVVLNTIRSITTIKCGKWVSATANAVCYGFYPLIVMLTAKDMVTIIANMIITAIVNFICVWLIKLVEEKARKDKLWKIEMAIPISYSPLRPVDQLLEKKNIPFNKIEFENWYVYNCYCTTQQESAECVKIVKEYGGKISAYESQNLL